MSKGRPCIRRGLDERAAVPDVRDGLTVAARCALRALHGARTRSRTYVKSATIVAAALQLGPPPGDRAEADIYNEIVRLAQDFTARHPLVDGLGNFGSIDDDPPASMRYTEARLDLAGAALLADLEDGSDEDVLPASFPNLLVNGAWRTPPGALTRIAPHSLREIAAATIAFIDDPAIDVHALMGHLPGPDFPTGGILLGGDGIATAYATGRGRLWLRGRAHFESVRRGRQVLVVTQLPYGVTKAGELGFISELARLVHEERIGAIADLEDHSGEREGMRIVITVKGDADPTELLDELHQRSQLQTTFLMKIVALLDGEPRTLTLKQALGAWVEHQRGVIARRDGVTSAGRLDEIVKDDLRAVAVRCGDRRRTEIRR
ncbi:MAG TPA: DNA gyrase subunit A [Solirubrobacteraceae bacterium]|nr:DNA gyrase subunit A [Solirubrobacteraceae bacterium]